MEEDNINIVEKQKEEKQKGGKPKNMTYDKEKSILFLLEQKNKIDSNKYFPQNKLIGSSIQQNNNYSYNTIYKLKINISRLFSYFCEINKN